MTKDAEFDLDLSSFDPEEPADLEHDETDDGAPARALERLLLPFSFESIEKARKVLRSPTGLVEAKREGQSAWYNAAGSRVYVVKVTTGDDFQFVECSCPNGVHRGGEAICYHSIAARVREAGTAVEGLFVDGVELV